MLKDDILNELKNRGDYCSGQELCGRFGVTRTAVWKAVSKLKQEGYNIEARQNRGYRLLSGDDVMNEAELRRARYPLSAPFRPRAVIFPSLFLRRLSVS